VAKREEFYRWVKVVGFASFIPLTLVSGPLGGYFLGNYLEKRFSWGAHTTLILVLAGLVGSIFETIRIINAMIKVDKEK